MVHGIDVIDIDAHAKRLGAHKHPAAARRKRVLNDLLVRGIFAAVIAQDLGIRNAALIDDRIDMTLIWAIDNGMAVVAHSLINPLLGEVGFYLFDGTGQLAFTSPDNIERDVVTTRVAQERLAVAKLQVGNRMRNDIIAPAVDSRGGKAEDRKAHTVFAELRQIRSQIPVVRAEIFTPRGNGVDLVNDDKTELAAVENCLDRGLQQEFRRQVDDGGLAAFNAVEGFKTLAIGNVRVNGNDILNATFPQVSDLVDH